MLSIKKICFLCVLLHFFCLVFIEIRSFRLRIAVNALFLKSDFYFYYLLTEVPRHCSTECYVDDTKLFFSFNLHDSQRIVQQMNEDLLQLRNWCFGNRLLLNPDKTKLIVFGSRQMSSKLHEFHLPLLGKEISPVQSARDLGVILDPNLTFDNHITTSVLECIARLIWSNIA